MIVIFGPTSSGKTSLAVALCKALNGEIISADSRQVYKGMDIGTGKLPVDKFGANIKKHEGFWEVDGIKIHGYDLVAPDRYFSAYDFGRFALDKIRRLRKEGVVPFLVGGTGFFIDVVTGRVKLSGSTPDLQLRKALNNVSTRNLVKKLKELDPTRATKIDKNNRRRIIRAIEIASSEVQDKPLDYVKDGEFQYIGLTADRSILYGRTDSWVDLVWNNGLVQETESLLKKYPTSDKLNGIVYKTVISYLKGEINREEAVQKTKYDLHAYVRRQLTWFKKYKNADLFDIAKPNLHKNVLNLIKSSRGS